MLRICIAAVVLGLGVLCALWLGLGEQHVFNQLALFFGKAAFLTCGSAYAVLPYVFDTSVQYFHWLNTAQMLDGTFDRNQCGGGCMALGWLFKMG